MAKVLVRYFLAIVPPEPILSLGWQEKSQLSEAYCTKGALRSPPHVTLHMPFLFNEAKEAELKQKVASLAATLAPPKVAINSYGRFGQRVLFWKVRWTPELDQAYQATQSFGRQVLNLSKNGKKPERAFRPHVTLAFRDLKKERFEEAWNLLKDKKLDYQWQAENLSLLKHDGKAWQELSSHPFRR